MSPQSGDGWTLHAGDCLAGLASLADDSVDVTITDPPYEYEAHSKGKRQGKTRGNVTSGCERRSGGKSFQQGRPGKVYNRVVDQGFAFNAISESDRQLAGEQIARVTRKVAAVWCQVEAVHLWRAALEQHGLVYRRTVPWVKPDAMPSLHGRWPGQAFESLVIAMKPGATAPIGGKAKYYECSRERGEMRAHPTAKPLALMLDVVEDFSEPGDLVLDAFAGSGTTGVACRQLGRRFIGWELLDGTMPIIDDDGVVTYPNYYEIARKRIAGERVHSVAGQVEMFA